MLGLSRRTEVNKRINKTTIYEKFQLDPKQKDSFDADVSFIYVANEISEYSVGVAPGEDTFSIHILRVVMKTKDYNDSSIIRLFKLIGNKVILALEHEDEVQIAAYHTKLFKTKWQPIDEATISLGGLNLDSIYVNLITQIGGFEIEQGRVLDEQIAADEQKAKLEKEIARLERQARNEKQPKKKFELVQMIKKLKEEMNSDKKSSIFMIVYVVFLFISAYISKDEYLSKIALGATLAGMFFACSDMFLNPAQYFGSQLNDLKKSQLELKNEILNYPEEKRGEQYLVWQKKLDSNEDFLNKNLKKTKRMHIAGYIFFALGIFVFLMILAFYNPDFKVFGILLKNERTITILAFAIVVFNYSMQDLLFVKHKKNLETLENISEDENNG